jgi:hypothetical protein
MARSEEANPRIPCECGQSISLPRPGKSRHRLVTCRRCGRLTDLELVGDRWFAEGVLAPEGSVPVSGFSMSLRLEPDVQRFWFRESLPLSGTVVVHVVFVPSSGEAEVKAADQKALRFHRVKSAAEARRRWLAVHRAPAEGSQARRRLKKHSPRARAES